MLVPALHTHHPRQFETNRFVYPVVSRRSEGVSVGINLNPDKVCNFDCIYCQVDRTRQQFGAFVELPRLLEELESTLRLAASGDLFAHPRFDQTPPALRVLRDMAFSGDGEPTTYRNFDQIVAQCAEVKQRLALDEVKMVLITNASMFHRPAVQRGLAILDAHQGEIWAKLEAGTPDYFQRVERTTIPFRRILDNITAAAQVRPLVIQSLWMRIQDEAPPQAELEAFCDRLLEMLAAGGRIRRVQVYTVARPPAESFVAALSDAEVDAIAQFVQRRTGLEVKAYYGKSD